MLPLVAQQILPYFLIPAVTKARSELRLTYPLGHALRQKTAGQFGPDLAKKLSQLVKMEKNVMRSMELVGRERMEVAVCNNLYLTFLTNSRIATTLYLGRGMR